MPINETDVVWDEGGIEWDAEGDVALANRTLNDGILFKASAEERNILTGTLIPEDIEDLTAKIYYDQKFGTNNTPEMVQQQIWLEYGENATSATANAGNKKAAEWMPKAVAKSFGKSTLAKAAVLPEMVEDRPKLMEDIAQKIGLPANSGGGEMLDSIVTTVTPGNMGQFRHATQILVGLIPEKAREKMANFAFSKSKEASEIQSEYLSGTPLIESIKNKDAKTAAKDVATAIAFESPNLAVQLGIGRFSPQASLLYMGAGAAAEKRAELGDEESSLRNVVNPLVSGILELGTEKYIGTGRIMDKAFKGEVVDGVVNNLGKIGLDYLGGGASEWSATVGGNLLDKAFGDDVDALEGGAMSFMVGGLMDTGVSTAFTLGDANRTRKQNSNEQIAAIVEADKSTANDPEGKVFLRDALETPSDATVGALNNHLFPAEEAVGDEKTADDTKPVSKEKAAPEVREGALSEQETLDMLDSIEDAPIKEISERAQKVLDIGEAIKTPFRKMASLTTRVKEIAPKAKIAMDKADQKTHKIISSNTKTIVPFAESVKKVRKNISKAEWKVVKAEILNGDWVALEARGIEGMAELRQMFQETADSLGIKTIENYFRRRVKDYDGLIKHLGEKPKGRFKKALDAKALEKGKALTPAEKKAVIREALRTKEGSGLNQKRTIDNLTPEMAEFYEDPLTELENYIRTSAQTIARKEMLGIDQGISDELGEVDPSVTEDDIASIVAEMAEEGISRKDEKELSELLKSHLEYKRAPKFVSMLRRLVAVKYVTKIKTTVKQWGDFFVTMAENGVVNTFGSANEAKNWSNSFGKEVELSLQEQGVEKLDAELQADKRKLIEEMIFKPLQSQDLLGKRILMRSTAMKWRRLAKSNPAKLKKQLMKKFEHEEFVDGIIADMKSGVLSEDVSFALYSQMADFHPISHSQHIKLYIDHPILRPLFMLKSFAFKRYDRLYREGISQVINGLAQHKAAAIDGDVQGRKDAASELASGILGVSRFMIFAVGGEMVIEKMYKEAMQALGFAPEEIPEDESWSSMYIQEASKVAPFVDPFALENAIERGDPMHYFDKAYDVPGPLGSDAVVDLIKHMRGTKDADVNKWKKDIPWFGELMWGAEQEGRERELMKKRRSDVKKK